MREFLRAIRESVSPATWSRGVELARANAVVGEADEGDEIVLRVSTRGGLVSPQVVLMIDDEDWTCECNSSEDACAHVAAAAIALKQARDAGKKLPGGGAQTPGRIVYRLKSCGDRLVVERTLVQGDREQRLIGSLAEIALGKKPGLKVMATDLDRSIEKILGVAGPDVIPRPAMVDLLRALHEADPLTLDGEPIAIGSATCGLAARITANGDERFVQLEQDLAVRRLFANGALVRDGELCPLAEHGLSHTEFDRLRAGKTFTSAEQGTLVGDVLPRLRRHMRVIGDVQELPQTRVLRPRIVLATERDADALTLLPTITYGDPPVARVDGERLTMVASGDVPLRNPRLEAILRERLRDLGFEVGTKTTLAPQQAIARLEGLRGEADLEFEGTAHREFVTVGQLRARLDVDDRGRFSLWFETEVGDAGRSIKADAKAVIAAWERGDGLAGVMEGGFGRIPLEWLARHGHRILALLSAREAAKDGGAPAWAARDLAALCEALEQPAPPQFERLRRMIDDFSGIAEPELPDDLTATLRDYQRRGIAWLQFLRNAELGALLADDMGLGKTLQALCAATGSTLVVAPTSVLHNWAAEVAKFRGSLTTHVYHGPERSLDPGADITLTTYAILRLDIDTLAQTSWDTIILDEAQAIKNPDSKVARAAYRLAGRFRVALTGTPVENRLEDLWSQFHFINPGLLGGRSEFHDHYVRAMGQGHAGVAEQLHERIRPFVLRRLKREVARELPPRTDVVLRCELAPQERKVYDTVRAATQAEVLAKLGGGSDVLGILEALLRLRQAACHRALLPGEGEHAPTMSAKVKLLLETLDEAIAEGHKALVFSQWTGLLDLVEPHLRAADITFVRLDGSTRDRQSVVDAFQSEDGPPVMLISLRAGGTGLNLTAADHVFLLDPWWNPAVEDQAADRAHRIGQTNPVLVHRLVARDTVEERILALQARKRQLAEAAVGDATGAQAITREELLALLH